jgi:HSP20 family protein
MLHDDLLFELFGYPLSRRVSFLQKELRNTKEGVTLTLDLPGYKPEDVSVELQKNHLSIKGVKDGKDTYLRVYEIGDSLDTEQITAKLEFGVLTVQIFNQKEEEPKKIVVRVG